MEELDFNKMNLPVNPITEQLPENSQSSESEKQFQNLPKQEQSKGVIEMPKTIKQTKLQKSLDTFIQSCLNKYKPLEHPDPSLYTNTAENEKDLIISKKSTIPDLVIWNKTFNKNECFIDADIEVQSDFPRYRFFLRLGNKDKGGKNKNEKNKNKEKKNKKNKKDKNNNPNKEEDMKEETNNLIKDFNNLNINNNKKDSINNMNNFNQVNPNNENKKKKEKKKKNNKNKEKKNKKNKKDKNNNPNKFNLNLNNVANNKYDNLNNMNNMNNLNNNNPYQQKIGLDNQHMNNQMNNFNLLNNKFSMAYNNNNNNNNIGIGNNNYNNNNRNMYQKEENTHKEEEIVLYNLIKMYLNEKGWIIFVNDGKNIGNLGPFNSVELLCKLFSKAFSKFSKF